MDGFEGSEAREREKKKGIIPRGGREKNISRLLSLK
jgi:hypothetical protein